MYICLVEVRRAALKLRHAPSLKTRCSCTARKNDFGFGAIPPRQTAGRASKHCTNTRRPRCDTSRLDAYWYLRARLAPQAGQAQTARDGCKVPFERRTLPVGRLGASDLPRGRRARGRPQPTHQGVGRGAQPGAQQQRPEREGECAQRACAPLRTATPVVGACAAYRRVGLNTGVTSLCCDEGEQEVVRRGNQGRHGQRTISGNIWAFFRTGCVFTSALVRISRVPSSIQIFYFYFLGFSCSIRKKIKIYYLSASARAGAPPTSSGCTPRCQRGSQPTPPAPSQTGTAPTCAQSP